MTITSRTYDLEDRTLAFARAVRKFLIKVPKSIANIEDGKQLVRSSASIGANYIEANESLGKNDFAMKVKICKKEAKETAFWLNIIDVDLNAILDAEREKLLQESKELVLIFGAMLRNFKAR